MAGEWSKIWNLMSRVDLHALIEQASYAAETVLMHGGQFVALWFVIKADGNHDVIRDLGSLAEMQAAFEQLGVIGYVFMCETSCESQPIIVFRAEDEGGALTAVRSIERRARGKAQLGPLMLDPIGSNPGKIRSIRMWPKTLQCEKRMPDETPPADDKPKRNRSGPESTYDGRPSVNALHDDPLLANLREVHREPRFDLYPHAGKQGS
jgi:hypothetical protein